MCLGLKLARDGLVLARQLDHHLFALDFLKGTRNLKHLCCCFINCQTGDFMFGVSAHVHMYTHGWMDG